MTQTVITKPQRRVISRPDVRAQRAAMQARPQTPERMERFHAGEPEQRGETISQVPPFFTGEVQVWDWSSSPGGYNVKLKLSDALFAHPFKGLNTSGKKRNAGQRLHIVVSGRATYQGQCILTWRGDDSLKGMAISLKLDVFNGEHPFIGCRTISDVSSDFGSRSHQPDTLKLEAWVVDDDEYLIKPSKPFNEMSPVQQAQIKCRLDRDFQVFCMDNLAHLMTVCGETAPELTDDMDAKEMCEHIVRAFCGITSRSELNEDSRHGFDSRMKWALLLSYFEKSCQNMTRYDMRNL